MKIGRQKLLDRRRFRHRQDLGLRRAATAWLPRIHGDRELAYQGDPKTGEPLEGFTHAHHIWNVTKVRALVTDQSHAVLFFCGGSRSFDRFIDLFDGVFVLEVDIDTLNRRLAARPENEWGGRASEREFVARLHATKEDIPRTALTIGATMPIARVVDEILGRAHVSRLDER